MSDTILARREKDGITVTLSIDKIESVQMGNFSGTLPCVATGVSGICYRVEPKYFDALREKGFGP